MQLESNERLSAEPERVVPDSGRVLSSPEHLIAFGYDAAWFEALSGQHGIGLLKKQFMEVDVGPDALALMRNIKDAIDPLGIMNPGPA